MRVLVNRSSTRGRTFVWRTAPATEAVGARIYVLLAGVLAGGWREALRFVV